MEKSTSIVNIAKALASFQAAMGKIPKDASNPFFKAKYASLPNILDAIHKPLADCGLCYSQLMDGDNGLTTILMHPESGEFLQATGNMHIVKSDPQALGSAVTYSRRYALGALLGLNIDDDDDGNAASQPKKQTTQNQGQAPKQNNNGNDKPWLSEQQFKVALARILAGEEGIIPKLDESFKMKKEYREKLNEAQRDFGNQ